MKIKSTAAALLLPLETRRRRAPDFKTIDKDKDAT